MHPSAADGTPEPCVVELGGLEPDAFATVCSHLQRRDVAALTAASASLRQAVASNDRLWSSLYAHAFPEPWQRLTQVPPAHQQPGGVAPPGVSPGGWRHAFLATHAACQRLRASSHVSREWATDSAQVHLVALHGADADRLTLVAQGNLVELRCAAARDAPAGRSIQCYGHSGRVAAAALLDLGGTARRMGFVTASHDQTLRLWATNMSSAADHDDDLPITLLTPMRSLRGHTEALTSLKLVESGSVTLAATGSKDRAVRLWGLAPLLPSPAQKSIAVLRGHGAPVSCLALAGGGGHSREWGHGGWDGGACGGSGGATLLSGSLDGRVKAWDVWVGAAAATAKLPGAVAAMQPAAGNPALAAHSVLVSGGSWVQLLDLRSMKASPAATLAERAQQACCFAQVGWDLAVGGSDGARVFDLRRMPARGAAPAPGGSSGAPERLRLRGHAGPVTTIHLDRSKLITATCLYGEAPVRVWCAVSGDSLVEFDSCLPPRERGAGGGSAAVAGGQHAAMPVATGDESSDESPERQPRRAYRPGWEGVSAMACHGAVLVTGNKEGVACERDFSRGGPQELLELGDTGGGVARAGKFWQYQQAA